MAKISRGTFHYICPFRTLNNNVVYAQECTDRMLVKQPYWVTSMLPQLSYLVASMCLYNHMGVVEERIGL